MSALAPVSSSAPIAPTSHKRRAQQAELKEHGDNKRVELVEWNSLYDKITTALDGGTRSAQAIAFDLYAIEVETLPLLCHYRFSDAQKKVKELTVPPNPALEGRVTEVLKEIYLEVMINTRFGKVTKDLEENISVYLRRTNPEYANLLIREAEYVLSRVTLIGIDSIETRKASIAKLSLEISELLALNCYSYIEYYEPILFLVHNANQTTYDFALDKNVVTDRYPKSKASFARLQQQLAMTQHQRAQLQALATKLRDKAAALTNLAQPLYAQQAPAPVSNTKEIFFHDNYELFWNLAVKIIAEAHIETFGAAQSSRQYKLPKEFKTALKEAAATDAEWNQYKFTYFLHHPRAEAPKPFLCTFWANFSKADPEELMRNYVNSRSEAQIETLKSGLAAAEDKAKFLEETIRARLPSKPTFLKLKTWHDGHKPCQL